MFWIHAIRIIRIIIIIIIIVIIIIVIPSHCDHSEAHYSLKQVHIINNIMIKIPTVKIAR